MHDFHIRQATQADAAGIARVHVGTWQYTYKGQIPDTFLDNLSAEKRTEDWKENLKDPTALTRCFVAEIKGSIVGFASAGPCRDEDMESNGELWAIYIDQDFMNQGIGTKLQKACFTYLKEHGYKHACVWVLATNSKSREWYQSRGWRLDGKTKTDKLDGVDVKEVRYGIGL